MSDESLIRALRALDRPVDVDPAFDDALFAILEREYALRRQFRPRVTLLLVAAFLIALLVGGAVAVGSGLLSLPWTNDRSLIPPGAAVCRSDLPAGQLLELVVNEEGIADPGDEWGPSAGFVVRVYDDGLLLTAGHGRTVEQIRAGESGMTARRLSPAGAQLILQAAEEDVLGSGCHDRWADVPERYLSIRGDGGDVLQVAWGRPADFIRQMTMEEREAAERFVERLADPESWLPAEGWVDSTERPYVPDRWLVNVELSADLRNADPQPGPDAEEVVLPDGMALLAFGDPYQEPDGAAAPGQPGRQGRCAVVDADFARNLAELFADAGAVAHNQVWWFRSGADPAAVHVWPLLPTDEGCTARMLGLTESPGPSPSPRPQPSGDLALVDSCGFLSEVSVRTAMAIAAAKPIVITDQTARVEMGRFGDDYQVCSYHLGEIWDDPSVLVHVRTWSTQVAEARALAHEILGGYAVEESATDRTLWQNGCPFEGDAQGPGCAPAIAISAEPYFIVITFHGYLTGDLPSIARTLAVAITAVDGDR